MTQKRKASIAQDMISSQEKEGEKMQRIIDLIEATLDTDMTPQELIESAVADQTTVAFLRIEWIGEDGFVCKGYGIDGNVYIKAPTACELFDTVRIEYYPALLQQQEGYADEGIEPPPNYPYSLVIEQPVSIRPSDPSAGEPVYK